MMTRFTKFTAITLLIGTLAACKSADERAEEKYQSGLALLEAGDADRAIIEFRNVFKLNGAHKEARRTLAEIQLERGQIRKAYGQYLRLAEQYPDDLDTRLILSELAFSGNNWEELERHGNEAVALAPQDPRAQIVGLAIDYRNAVAADDFVTSAALAKDAETSLGQTPDSEILRSILVDSAVRRSDFAEAITQIDALIALDPDRKQFHSQRLGIISQTNDTDAVEAQLRDMVARFDDTADKANLLRFYLALGRTDDAEGFLRENSDPSDADPTAFTDLIRFVAEIRGRDAALVEIERAIAANPNPAPFRALRAGLTYLDGNEAAGIAELEDILSTAEDSAETRSIKLQLARMLQNQDNAVGARRLVEEVLEADGNNGDALKMQAIWQIAEDDTDGAILSLRTAIDANADDAEAMTLLAQAYTRAGSHDLSRDFLALAVDASQNAPAESVRYARVLMADERFRPAEDVLIPALRLAPDNIEILATLGQLYLDMEDRPRTDQVINTLRRLDTEQSLRIANNLATEQLQRMDGTAEALAYLENIAGTNSADLNTQLMLLRGRLATGDREGAEALINKLMSENPRNEQIAFAAGAVKAATGDNKGAADIFRELLDNNEERPRIWLELSRVLLREGDTEGADRAIQDGLAATDNDPNLLWARASVLERDGDYEGAIQIYESLYDVASSSAVVANNLASLLSTHRGDQASIDRAFAVARRLNNTDVPAFQDTYGWLLHLRGSSEEALPYLESAAIGLPDDPIVQYHLAQVYVALERKEDAITQLQRTITVAGPIDTRPQIQSARSELTGLQAEVAAEKTSP
jgi:tetratricopeptide (TPR) repeat protein